MKKPRIVLGHTPRRCFMKELKMFGFVIRFVPGVGGCAADPGTGTILADPSWEDLLKKFPGFICHEIGHLTEPMADCRAIMRRGMTNLEAQLACFKAHCSKKAMSFEVAADKKAVTMGEGHSLLAGLKKLKAIFGADAGADLDDRITRLEVWEKTGIFVEDGRTDLPSDEELKAMGIDLAAVKEACRQMLLTSGYDPDALAE